MSEVECKWREASLMELNLTWDHRITESVSLEMKGRKKIEQWLKEQGEVESTFNMGKAINLAVGRGKTREGKILDDKKRGKNHFEEIVTRHWREILWQSRCEEEKVEQQLRMGGRKGLWLGMEVRWERFFSRGVGILYEKKSSGFEKQIKDGKKRKGTKIGVSTNMKGSKKDDVDQANIFIQVKGKGNHGKELKSW